MPLAPGRTWFVRARFLAIVVALLTLVAAVGSLRAAPVVKWGPPYFAAAWQADHPCQDNTSIYKDRTVDEDTVDAAGADFKAAIRGCYGLSCTVTLEPTDPATEGGTVARTRLGGGCYVYGPVIKATGASASPSDGGPGGDGEGHQHDDSTPTVGDPANAQTGDKILQTVDYAGTPWLEFRRFYTSNYLSGDTTNVGLQWRHSFNRSLRLLGRPVTTAVATRPDGSTATYHRVNGIWSTDDSTAQRLSEAVDAAGSVLSYHLFVSVSRHDETYDLSGRLVGVSNAYGEGISLTYSDASTPVSVAPKLGLLLTVVDKEGRTLSFSYDANGNLKTLGLPDGTSIAYAYTSQGYLDSVTFADSKFIQYLYNETNLFQTASGPLLTGIVDEASKRYATIAYDSQQRTTGMNFGGYNWSATEGGSNGTQFSYNADTTTVTFPLGGKATFSFSTPAGLSRLAAVDTACNPDCGVSYKARTYDANGYPATTTDFLGQVTQTQYNAYGEVTSKVEAAGTDSQRTTTSTWNDALRVPTLRYVADKAGTITEKTGWVYDASGKNFSSLRYRRRQGS